MHMLGRSALRVSKGIRRDAGDEHQRAQKGYWSKLENQRQFLDSIAAKLNIKDKEEWYSVSYKDVYDRGGNSLISNCYKGSLTRAIVSIYSDYPWQIWRFRQVPRRFWKNTENLKQFVSHLEAALGISSPLDWYKVSFIELRALKAEYVIKSVGGLAALLSKTRPQYPWDSNRLHTCAPSLKKQSMLLKMAQNLFPGHFIHTQFQLSYHDPESQLFSFTLDKNHPPHTAPSSSSSSSSSSPSSLSLELTPSDAPSIPLAEHWQ
jgi:hypothetical protein